MSTDTTSQFSAEGRGTSHNQLIVPVSPIPEAGLDHKDKDLPGSIGRQQWMVAQERVSKQDETPLQNTLGRDIACRSAQEPPQRRRYIKLVQGGTFQVCLLPTSRAS